MAFSWVPSSWDAAYSIRGSLKAFGLTQRAPAVNKKNHSLRELYTAGSTSVLHSSVVKDRGPQREGGREVPWEKKRSG